MHVHEELNRDLVIIPIRDRSKKKVVYSKYDGVTVINITKEKGGKACYDCGILKKKTEELRDHQRYPTRLQFALDVRKNMSKHMKICQGHGSKFQCDQCDKTTRTFHGLRMHKTKFHELLEPIIRLTIVYELCV